MKTVTGITIEADSVVIKGSDFDALCAAGRECAQLRGELSLADEGLANYQQEVARLAKHNERLRKILTQAPIAKVTIRESGAGHHAPDDVSVTIYAPGLPPGEYDLYLQTEEIPAPHPSASIAARHHSK